MKKKLRKKISSKPVKSKKLKTPKGKKGLKKPVAKEKKRVSVLAKAEKNPIISPRPENHWEAWQTFNPGVVMLGDDVHFLYRAIGEDGISRLGYAMSKDGFSIDERLNEPAYEHQIKSGESGFNVYSYFSGGSFSGAEDPRLTRIENENTLYMTYTACDGGLRVGLTSIKVSDFLNKNWRWAKPCLISPEGEVHKNWLIFPEKIGGKYAILHSLRPEVQIEYVDSLEFDDKRCIKSFHGGKPRNNCWDKWIRGAGAPPLKTEKGWLLFYHAMDNDWSKYKVGAMLLDLNDPRKIIRRAAEPVLEPEKDYENGGFKAGVVYVSGVAVKNGELLVYYGASDSYIGVAHAPLEKFLEALAKEKTPKLKTKILRKR